MTGKIRAKIRARAADIKLQIDRAIVAERLGGFSARIAAHRPHPMADAPRAAPIEPTKP